MLSKILSFWIAKILIIHAILTLVGPQLSEKVGFNGPSKRFQKKLGSSTILPPLSEYPEEAGLAVRS